MKWKILQKWDNFILGLVGSHPLVYGIRFQIKKKYTKLHIIIFETAIFFLKLYKIIPTQRNSRIGVMTTKKSMCFLEQGKWNTLYKFTFKQNFNPLGLRWNKFPKNNLTHIWTRHLKQDRTYWPIPAKISGI